MSAEELENQSNSTETSASTSVVESNRSSASTTIPAAASSARGLPAVRQNRRTTGQALTTARFAGRVSQEFLWHTPDGEPFLTTDDGIHLPLDGEAAKNYLRLMYLKHTRNILTDSKLKDVVGVLRARADQGESHQVHVRVARIDRLIYFDLGDRVVEISQQGFQILDQAPSHVRFRRSGGESSLLPLPVASNGEGLTKFRRLINLKSDEEFVLVLGAMVGSMMGRGPYPVTVFTGPQGSAKSTATLMIKKAIDPDGAGLRNPPKNEQDLAIACKRSHIIGVDNVSKIRADMSDMLCSVATGVSLSKRKLYSDGDEFSIKICNPIFLNGIGDFIERSDLQDRAQVIHLRRLEPTEYQSDEDLWAEFEALLPKLLADLFALVSKALANLEWVKEETTCVPRMAQYFLFATAALGRDFADAYLENQRNAQIDLADDDDLVACIVNLVKAQKSKRWKGTPSELFHQLPIFATRMNLDQLPNNVWQLGKWLPKKSELLRAKGILFEVGRETSSDRKRFYEFRLMSSSDGGPS